MPTASNGNPSPQATRRRNASWQDAIELLSSMRFAIALLALICIASVIGTVVKQHEPYNNYVNQFGPFWAEVLGHVGLYSVYSAWWFLLILAFLVTSTSLCILRNGPKILAELRTFKEHLREQSLKAFHHKAEGGVATSPEASLAHVNDWLVAQGWQARAQVRSNGTMVAARKGMAHKLGYLAAHSAVVLICLGGLLDGDLIVRAQMLLLGKQAFSGGGLVGDVPAKHRLSERNPTFRGNLLVPEGQRTGVAILGMSDGVVLQDLPFDIELKKFIVEYYDTGMPKLFASEVVLHDHDTGAQRPVTIKVNEPAKHRGITIYQSSFEDGGSTLQLRALPLSPAGKTTDLQGKVGESRALAIGSGSDNLTLELTGLRVINVENMGAPETVDESTDTRSVKLANALGQHTGSGAKGDRAKVLHNIGPSFSYKLRDASGQAREFNNYMLPVDLDGQRVFLAGVRDTPSEPLRYLRIPADDKDSLATWLQTKAALADPALRIQAIKRYVTQATPADKPEMAEQLRLTADRVLSLFSGAERPPGPAGAETGGLRALAQFIEAKVPEAERPRASDVLLRVLSSCLFELTQIARAQAGSPPLPTNDTTRLFMQATTLSLSDAAHYPAPALLQLTNFTQVQASVFQLTRAPGKTLVYLGAVLLMIGVLAMLYIRERRLWIWLQPADGGGTRIQLALSTTRRTLDADAEFDALKHDLLSSPR